MDELINELPRSLELATEKGMKSAWLVITRDRRGVTWTAGYETLNGKGVDGWYFEGDTPQEALLRLKERREAFKKVSSLSGW